MSIRYLLTSLEILQEHASAEVAAWYETGIDQYMEEGDSLDTCLGLVGGGARSQRYVYLKNRRDRFLCQAMNEIEADCHTEPEKQVWEKAVKLRKAIHRFESTTWPRVRYKTNEPKNLPSIQLCLYHAFKTGIKIPSSTQGLVNVYQISGYSFLADPVL